MAAFLAALAFTVLAGLGAFFFVACEGAPVGLPALAIGPVILAEPWIETPLPIQFTPSRAACGGAVRIDGLPADVALTEGERQMTGGWVIPLAKLPMLRIKAPPTDGVQPRLSVALVSRAGTVLGETQPFLVVMPAWHVGSTAAQPAAASSKPPTQQSTFTTTSQPPPPAAMSRPPAATVIRPAGEPIPSWVSAGLDEEAKSLVRRGDEALREGSVQAARRIYEYAATQYYWPAAAFALAATYDPHELAHLAPFLPGERDEARFWYSQAEELTAARIAFYRSRLSTEP